MLEALVAVFLRGGAGYGLPPALELLGAKIDEGLGLALAHVPHDPNGRALVGQKALHVVPNVGSRPKSSRFDLVSS